MSETEEYPESLPPQEQGAQPGREGDMTPAPQATGMDASGRRLGGKVAIITGGDSGIGRAVAIAFAREGADVAFVYLPNEDEDAQETTKWVEQAGRKALAIPADIRDEQTCQQLVEQTVQEFGRLDILVNNAAYQMAQPGGLEDITTEQFDRVLKTNLYAMFWLCKAAVPHMPPGSSIINTSSVQAFQPSPHLLDYATTKAGIVNFTKGLGQQLAEQGIRVNSVAPGPIWTPLIPATMPEEKVEDFGSETPLGRVAQPAEVAPAFVFLASQESSYITGERIGVAGGMPFP